MIQVDNVVLPANSEYETEISDILQLLDLHHSTVSKTHKDIERKVIPLNCTLSVFFSQPNIALIENYAAKSS